MAERQNYLDVDVVQAHFKAATEDVGRCAAADYAELMEAQLSDLEYGPKLESPLEALFYVWWGAMIGPESLWGRRLQLEMQEAVEIAGTNYRLDFVIGLEADTAYEWYQKGRQWPRIAVEVDGHAFHEKTPDQVAKRNQRDRGLQQAGWIVFHFSWSELTSRPQQCIGEVLGVAREHYNMILAREWQAQQEANERAAGNQAGGD